MAGDTISMQPDACRACATARRRDDRACWWHLMPLNVRPPVVAADTQRGRLFGGRG